ncbi:hypothetical protein BOTCAL_0296g00050 [Botryotinia calthae]|uniref:Heterokaryon incompatibility domain-containing protein n=1 Tax=Botryotinia calthae TaxID=38488 RepID=A0A4Y8CVE7_9HELO|nr:hypothetical protein BOTCAL_0296g00050 [Botryotinia calthae]
MALRTPWPICTTCQAISYTLFQNGTINDPNQFWPSFSEFANSASRGCHTCTLLYEAVREPFKHRLENQAVFLERGTIGGDGTETVVLTVDPASLPDQSTWANEFLQVHAEDKLSDFKYLPIADVKYVSDAAEVPEDARNFKDLVSLCEESEGAIRYIKQSMSHCLENHKSTCDRVMFPISSAASQRHDVVNIVSGRNGMVMAPTRLIYVGSQDAGDLPKLVDGQECLYKGGYLVLSYCWGMTPKNAPWQLTTTTMPLFATEIPLRILPQTLHDAVMLTRKLGEHYIWIDSMCILQDSAEDWQFEASNMASIYGSAVMTIVAASSSVYGGVTDRRNPLRNSAASLDLQDGSSKFTVYILPNRQIRKTPLLPPTDSRGWCYQEDLLSSRLVKLTTKSVIWQCLGNKSNPNTRSQGLEQLIKHPPHRWHTLWYRLIEQYSNKSLTYPKDRLLAFYGIACDKAGDAYLAGLLKTDPWASLLWCRDENQIQRRPGCRYKEYVAPSWSWASIDAPVLFYEANARHWRKLQLGTTLRDPELIHAEAQPVSYFKTGAVKSGSVEISAYIIMARTAPVEPFLFNTRQGSHTYGRRNCVDPLTGDALGLIVFDVALEAQDDMLLCCALLQTGNMDLWEKNGTAGLGLALKVEGATAKHWKCTRVGYVQFTSMFGKYAQMCCVEIS